MICNKWVNWKILINSLSHADLPNVNTSINNIEKKITYLPPLMSQWMKKVFQNSHFCLNIPIYYW